MALTGEAYAPRVANEVLYETLELECLDSIRKTIGGRAPLLPVRAAPRWIDSSERLMIFVPCRSGVSTTLIAAAAMLGRKVAELALERLPAGVLCQMRVAFRRGDVGETLALHVGWSLEPA